MKNYLKSVLIIISLVAINSCNINDTPLEELKNDSTYELIGSDTFSDKSIIKNIETRLSANANTRAQSSFSVDLQFDFNDVKVASYTNTNIKSIIVNAVNSDEKSNYSYVTYLNDKDLSEAGFIINIELIGEDKYKIKYFGDNLELMGEVITENGLVTYSKSYIDITNGRAAGFWSDWGDCVGDIFDDLTDGSAYHGAVGLACAAAGAECAAAIGIACTIVVL